MDIKKEWKPLLLITGGFLVFYWLPVENGNFNNAVVQALILAKWYAREHVLLCLVPAFFIAGAISVFISQAAVMKYLGAQARKLLAYGVASVSGTILAVCSCTVLPLFAGIYKRGAGLGPATAFLYSGPAINVFAIILTARVLGAEMGVARAVGAVVFSVIIGFLMALIFHREEKARTDAAMIVPDSVSGRFSDQMKDMLDSSWGFAKQIMPLLFAGVLVAGFLLGGPGGEGIIPSRWVASLVGGNSPQANFFASIAGALMYFATLTEVPILQGLIKAGMGKGPALALLLAGPALSLPNMLVIRSVMGTKKTLVYIMLVVVMATISGLLFGILRG